MMVHGAGSHWFEQGKTNNIVMVHGGWSYWPEEGETAAVGRRDWSRGSEQIETKAAVTSHGRCSCVFARKVMRARLQEWAW